MTATSDDAIAELRAGISALRAERDAALAAAASTGYVANQTIAHGVCRAPRELLVLMAHVDMLNSVS